MTEIIHRACRPCGWVRRLSIFAGSRSCCDDRRYSGLVLVSQRTRRLGSAWRSARATDVLHLVLRQGLALALAGAAAGLVASWLVARLVTGLLYGVSPKDPLTFASVGSVLIAVALVACYIPARRATRVDPLKALRTE